MSKIHFERLRFRSFNFGENHEAEEEAERADEPLYVVAGTDLDMDHPLVKLAEKIDWSMVMRKARTAWAAAS